jgi:hypothetical protein
MMELFAAMALAFSSGFPRTRLDEPRIFVRILFGMKADASSPAIQAEVPPTCPRKTLVVTQKECNAPIRDSAAAHVMQAAPSRDDLGDL